VRPASLRWRLAGWVALVVVLSTGVAFVAVYRGTGTQLHRQIDSEIAGDAGALAHALASSGARTPRQTLSAARDYVGGRPFGASSTLLFATVPGAGTATNTPELFGNPAPDDGESVAVQEQENRLSHRLLTVGGGFSTLDLPDVGYLRTLKREVLVPGGQAHAGQLVTIGVGESLASVAHAQRGVARAFILAGLLTLAGALLASLAIGARFSRPLRRMAAVAAQVDAGDLHPRIHDVEREGQEVRVLADAFNHMLDRLTDAFAGQRAFVADASHELRTPLTVIRGQLEVLAAQQEPSGEEVRRVERLVQAEIVRVTRLVDDLLVLAKAEQAEFLRLEPIALEPFVEELWGGTTLLVETGTDQGDTRSARIPGSASAGSECLPASVPRRFELGEVPAGTLLADPDRLAQALRNLLANAIAHTERAGHGPGLVRLDVECSGGRGRGTNRPARTPSPRTDGVGGTNRPARTPSPRTDGVGGTNRPARTPSPRTDGVGGTNRPARNAESSGGQGQGGPVRPDVEWPEGGGRECERVRFLVQDDGPGIPVEQRERVFDRFHRTDAARDRASGGTGLGLAIVRAIAEAHGGRVAASESFAGGARVELELPGFTPASSPTESSPEPVPSAGPSSR
jgi:two-component system, OmpR family, sensor kinase